jgi:hypothetical protein
MSEMKIGDFTKPLVPQAAPTNAPADAPADAPTSSMLKGEGDAAEKLKAAEQRLEDKADETEAALKPKVDYEARLKEHGISVEDAAKIVDDVLFKGHYAEEVKVSSRVSIVLRTRQARDTARTLTYLEVHKPLYENNYNEHVHKHALAASLVRLGEDRFTFPSGKASTADEVEDAFRIRLAYVNALPDPVLRLLFLKLTRFDERVRIVLQEGAIENF